MRNSFVNKDRQKYLPVLAVDALLSTPPFVWSHEHISTALCLSETHNMGFHSSFCPFAVLQWYIVLSKLGDVLPSRKLPSEQLPVVK